MYTRQDGAFGASVRRCLSIGQHARRAVIVAAAVIVVVVVVDGTHTNTYILTHTDVYTFTLTRARASQTLRHKILYNILYTCISSASRPRRSICRRQSRAPPHRCVVIVPYCTLAHDVGFGVSHSERANGADTATAAAADSDRYSGGPYDVSEQHGRM